MSDSILTQADQSRPFVRFAKVVLGVSVICLSCTPSGIALLTPDLLAAQQLRGLLLALFLLSPIISLVIALDPGRLSYLFNGEFELFGLGHVLVTLVSIVNICVEVVVVVLKM